MEDKETGNVRRVFGRVVEDLSINRSPILEEMAFLVALIITAKIWTSSNFSPQY